MKSFYPFSVLSIEQHVPEELRCLVCRAPHFHAMRSTCGAHLCRACYETPEDLRVAPHYECDGLCVWEADSACDTRLKDLIKPYFHYYATIVLHEEEGYFLDASDVARVHQLVDAVESWPDVCGLFQRLRDLSLRVRESSLTPISFREAYQTFITCSAADDLATVEAPEAVLSLRVAGDWFTHVKDLHRFHALVELSINGCRALHSLRGIERLQSLKRLTVSFCNVRDAEGLAKCPLVEDIEFCFCSNLRAFTSAAAAQRSSQRRARRRLHRHSVLPAASPVPSAPPAFCATLRRFSAPQSKLEDLSFLRGCVALQHLNVRGSKKLLDVGNLSESTQLAHFDASWSDASDPLRALDGFARLAEVRVSGCDLAGALTPLRCATQMTVFEASKTDISSLDGLGSCAALERVDVSACRALADFSALSNLALLKHLNLSFTDVATITFARSMATLEEVHLAGCKRLRDWEPCGHFAGAPELRVLDVAGCIRFNLSRWQRTPPKLQELILNGCTVHNIEVLRQAPQLTKLHLRGTAMNDDAIAVLADLPQLTDVDLSKTRVTDVAPLAACAPVLKSLQLRNCAVSDISVLREALKLFDLDLRGTQVHDLNVLRGSFRSAIPNLRHDTVHPFFFNLGLVSDQLTMLESRISQTQERHESRRRGRYSTL